MVDLSVCGLPGYREEEGAVSKWCFHIPTPSGVLLLPQGES